MPQELDRKIYGMIFFLMLSICLLATSTYAWFSHNDEIGMSGVDLKVKSSRGMEISADAKSWREALTAYDILKADYESDNRLNQLPIKYQPVSTIGNLHGAGLIEMFFGTVGMDRNPDSPNFGKKTLTASKIVEGDGETGNFLAFDLYFKSSSVKKLYLGRKSYVNFIGEEDRGIKNAMRLAFVKEGVLPLDAPTADIQALATTNLTDVLIWEPNYNSHTESAVTSTLELYNKVITTNETNPLDYYGVKTEITSSIPLASEDPQYVSLVKDNLETTATSWSNSTGSNILIAQLEPGITKIRIYAWVEGQDVDCENEASGSSFEFNLHFTNNSMTK